MPQGSILGPLLFLIFINDIVKDIKGIIRLFADDTILFDIVEDPLLTGITLNVDLSRIFAWAKQWLVEFQPIKQESFIASKKRVKPRHPPLYMGNTQIKEVDSHKHLGIELANDMSWKTHINTIVNKAYKRLGILRKHKFNLDRRSLDKMYKVFIRPLIEYGNIIWDNCSKENKKALENIQLDAQRISTGATKLCSVQKLYNETGYETLETRRKKQKLCQMYKITHNLTPDYLKRLLPPRIQDQSRYQLRNPNNYMVPITRTTFYFNSFLPSTLREWNSLNIISRNSTTLASFKRTLSTPSKVFLWEKVKTVDFSETIAASDLKVGRCRQLIEFMKVCEYCRSRSFLSIQYIFQVLYLFCFNRPRHQMSVYRTIGPLVLELVSKFYCTCIISIWLKCYVSGHWLQ